MSLLLYRLFLLLYKTAALMISPWNPKARLWINGRKGLMVDFLQKLSNLNAPLIWVHCASLGEFEQGRPVMEELKKNYPSCKIVLTFFSPSGYEIRKNYGGADLVSYLPADSPTHAADLLSRMKPRLVIWVKYEYWYYYLSAIRGNNIPLLLISGIFRDNQVFFKFYGGLHRKMLYCFSHLFVQNNPSKKKLGSIGLSGNVSVSGDTRFDRVAAIAGNFEPVPLVDAFCGSSPVVVAGSTWPEDEEELDHFANTHPEIKFIIAPHEISEDHLKDVEKLFRRTIRYSALTGYSGQNIASDITGKNVLLIDNIGMLSRLYKYATITYVGGGFGDSGLHNVLEAAVYGRPVLFGPEYGKFAEASELIENGGAFSAETALELETLLNYFLEDKEAYSKACKSSFDYVQSKRGATARIMNYIQEKRLLTS